MHSAAEGAAEPVTDDGVAAAGVAAVTEPITGPPIKTVFPWSACPGPLCLLLDR